jgi:dihydromethanopterin reductase (acceptor)
VFACDTAEEMESMAPDGMVKVYPRWIDLKNVEKLKDFAATTVVDSVETLRAALDERMTCLNASSS